jgi:hypothetical protein
MRLDDLHRLRTRARHALKKIARTRDTKPMFENAAQTDSREEEAATLRCLVAMAGFVEAWEPDKVKAIVVPGGLVAVRPDGEDFTCYHTGTAHEAWGMLIGLGKINADDAVWFLRVDENCEAVESVSRSEL